MNEILASLYDRYYRSEGPLEEDACISSHWQEESKQLFAELDSKGEIAPTSRNYWGCQWNSLTGRGFDIVHKLVHIPGLSNKRRIFRLWRQAAETCSHMGLDPTYTVFRQVCTVELLDRHLDRVKPKGRLRILVIGDGAGVLSGLLKAAFPPSTIAMVDLGKPLLYQAYHCQKAYPAHLHALVSEDAEMDEADFLYCPADALNALEKYQFDIAVNVASMQEMNAFSVSRYFDFMRQRLRADNLFYCCNRESKTLVGGEVSEFYSYPWRPQDDVLVEEECPWHRYVVGRTKEERGPEILGIRVPFLSYFDGIILHRLVVLSS